MQSHTSREITLAAGLSAVAGFVDALGFIHLGGYFLSFMTGNSTRAGASLAQSTWTGFALAFGLIAAFLCGVIAASTLRRLVPRRKRLSVLMLVTLVLAAAATIYSADIMAALIAPSIAFAMGAENAVFERGGEVSLGLTYMTGTLVKMGQRIAGAFFGGHKLGWLRYFWMWASLTAGSLAGGLCYALLGLSALWIAVAAVLLAGILIWRRPGHRVA